MKHSLFIRLFIIIIIFQVVGFTHAQESVFKKITPPMPIRVGIFQSYPIVYEAGGLPTGFHLELLKEVAKQEGWTLTYKFMGSPKNVIQGLENGTLDVGMSLVPTRERQRFLEFTKEKNALLTGRIIVRSEENAPTMMSDLKGKSLAVVNQDVIGQNSVEIFEKLGIKTNFRQVRSNDELVKALLSNVVDAGICNNLQGGKYVRQYNVYQTSIVFKPTEVHFAVPKGKNNFILAALDQHLREWKMTKGSVYHRLEKEFLNESPSYTPTYTNRELMIALSLCLLFILFGTMLGSFMATESESDHAGISATHIRQIILFIAALNISFWLMDSGVEWLLFNEGRNLSLLELTITGIPTENLYIRGMFFLVCCFFGLFLARYISKYERMLNLVLISVDRFEQLTDNSRDMIYRMNLPNGEYDFVSKASVDIFGYSPEEFYKRPLLIEKLIHPDWKRYFRNQWKKLLAGDLPPYYEYQIIDKAGEVRWINQRNTLYRDDSGVPISIEGIVTDMTEQKKAAHINNEC